LLRRPTLENVLLDIAESELSINRVTELAGLEEREL
jgi:hypothetical protein